jgi:hypothetical protein
MIRSPLRETARIVLIVALAAAAALLWLQAKPLESLHRHSADPPAASDPPRTDGGLSQHPATGLVRRSAAATSLRRADTRPDAGGGKPTGLGPLLARWGRTALLMAAVMVLATLAAALALLGPRLRARHRRARERQRYELIPYRNDDATPERMVQVFQALGATLGRRWFRRLLAGAPTIALETHVLPRSDGPARVVLTVLCSPQDALLVDSCLQIAYPDVRVGYEFTVAPRPAPDAPSWTRYVKRLTKLRPFIAQVGIDPMMRAGHASEHQLIDDLLVNLAEVKAPVSVQLAITPAPGWVHRLARRAYREEEHAIAGLRNAGELGERSPSADAQLRGSLASQHQLLFYCDIRCASCDPGVALLAAQSLSQAAGVNRLRVREPWLLRELHARRIPKGLPKLLPPVRHGILSSAELAHLWQLPSHRPKSVAVKRSNLLREPASAAVWRPKDPEHTLAHDERGPIGIRAGDRRLGVRFTGVPGAGKTTGMVKLWGCDVQDRSGAQIGFDPKTEAAEAWLGNTPADRKVYFLDLARPEFGMSPLTMRASMEVIGDCVVEGLRDINDEGAIMAASDRYLRSATYGALLLANAERRAPSWYQLYQQLWPDETGAELRSRVCELCEGNSDLVGLRAFYGQILPSLLTDSRSQVAIRMDAPGNKLQRLLNQPTIARMLHHPVQVSIDDIIAERAVLIVQCSMGEIGEEQAVIVLLMLLRELHTALQRQQLKPADERVSIYWHLDEAHFVWSRLLEVILSTGRSALLHAALAWQHEGQIEERRLAKGILADLQTSISFRCGDPEEAEAITAQAMTAYVSRWSGEQSDRDAARVTPDSPLRLTHHYALMHPIVDGDKDKPAIIHFDPIRTDADAIAYHHAAQRARGCFYPEDMPDPFPTRGPHQHDDGAIPATSSNSSADEMTRALPLAPATATSGDNGSEALGGGLAEPATSRSVVARTRAATPVPSPSTVKDESTRPPRRQNARAPSEGEQGKAPARPPTRETKHPRRELASGRAERARDASQRPDHREAQDGTPPRELPEPARTFSEIDFDVEQLIWDTKRAPAAARERPNWTPEDLQALAILHNFGPLLAPQIARRVWPGRSERTTQRHLEAMYHHGLVNRCHLATPIRHPYIYALAEPGFKLACEAPNDEGRTYLDPATKLSTDKDELPDPTPEDSRWRESALKNGLYILRNLHSSGWILAAANLLGESAKRVHGGRESSCALHPPRGSETRSAVAMRGNRSVGDLKLERFPAIWADARLDVQVPGHPMIHWYIECDRSIRRGQNLNKLRAYDAMFNGWGSALSGYRRRLPIVIFICTDERQVLAHLVAADRELTGWVAGLAAKQEDRIYIGRQRTWFVTELDVHRGSLRAWRVPDLPPAARKAQGHPEKMRPVLKTLAPVEKPRARS